MPSHARAKILLRAAYDMLKKCDDSTFVLSPMETTIYYDGTDCDGSCLKEDIACELGLDSDTEPNQKPESEYQKALRTGVKPEIWPPLVMSRDELKHFRANCIKK